jgi:hypothetical protein
MTTAPIPRASNQASSVDAPIASLWTFLRQGRRATDQHRSLAAPPPPSLKRMPAPPATNTAPRRRHAHISRPPLPFSLSTAPPRDYGSRSSIVIMVRLHFAADSITLECANRRGPPSVNATAARGGRRSCPRRLRQSRAVTRAPGRLLGFAHASPGGPLATCARDAAPAFV